MHMKRGQYAWKAEAINGIQEKYGGVVVWLDTGVCLTSILYGPSRDMFNSTVFGRLVAPKKTLQDGSTTRGYLAALMST